MTKDPLTTEQLTTMRVDASWVREDSIAWFLAQNVLALVAEVARLRDEENRLGGDLAAMEGERDALLARCREAVTAIDALVAKSQCVKQCTEIGDWCRCGVRPARDHGKEISDRLAAAIKGVP